jgi:integrase
MNAIGATPLLAEREVLQKVVKERSDGNAGRQRRLCSKLNQMRRWFGITKDRLKRAKKQRREFRYLTEAEFIAILPHIRECGSVSAEILTALFTLLFYSGARTGEAFAFRPHHLNQNQLKVHTQVDREEKEIETKNGKLRTTYLDPNGLDAFQAWVAFSGKTAVDRNALSRIFKGACKRAFPSDSRKWVTVHDLRHSYAVRCLTVFQLSIEHIAKLLGNTIAVCEEYYLAFVENDDFLTFVAQKARNSRSS